MTKKSTYSSSDVTCFQIGVVGLNKFPVERFYNENLLTNNQFLKSNYVAYYLLL